MIDHSKIKEMQVQRKLSNRKFARMIKMSDTGYAKMIENKTCKMEKLKTIADFFELPVSYFLKENKSDTVSEPSISYFSCQDCVEKQKRINELIVERDMYMKKYIDCLEDLQEKKSTAG